MEKKNIWGDEGKSGKGNNKGSDGKGGEVASHEGSSRGCGGKGQADENKGTSRGSDGKDKGGGKGKEYESQEGEGKGGGKQSGKDGKGGGKGKADENKGAGKGSGGKDGKGGGKGKADENKGAGKGSGGKDGKGGGKGTADENRGAEKGKSKGSEKDGKGGAHTTKGKEKGKDAGEKGDGSKGKNAGGKGHKGKNDESGKAIKAEDSQESELRTPGKKQSPASPGGLVFLFAAIQHLLKLGTSFEIRMGDGCNCSRVGRKGTRVQNSDYFSDNMCMVLCISIELMLSRCECLGQRTTCVAQCRRLAWMACLLPTSNNKEPKE